MSTVTTENSIYCYGGYPSNEYPYIDRPDTSTGWQKYSSPKKAGIVPNSNSSLNYLDWSIISFYFTLVLFVGLWSMRQNRSRGTVSGYFLANKNMHWTMVGASLFASNIGSTHFVGLAGSGASGGWTVAAYEFSGMIIILLLGYLFAPVYLSCNVRTMPEYLKVRFGRNRLNFIISGISLVIYIFTKISVDLYAGAIFLGMGN